MEEKKEGPRRREGVNRGRDGRERGMQGRAFFLACLFACMSCS